MSDARSAILARIRAALDDPAPVATPAPEMPPTPEVATPEVAAPALEPGPGALVARFAARVADYRATITIAEPGAGVREAVAAALARHGARRVAVPGGLPAAWVPAGVEVVPVAPGVAPDVAALDAVDGVLTTCALAIAETGTIVLDGGEGQGPRAATLLPDLHVCVVDAGRIVPGVGDAMGVLAATVAATGRPLTFVSGPSATSDIELDRVEGVHGPRRLEVVLYAAAGGCPPS